MCVHKMVIIFVFTFIYVLLHMYSSVEGKKILCLSKRGRDIFPVKYRTPGRLETIKLYEVNGHLR